jgi:hypothetical protein
MPYRQQRLTRSLCGHIFPYKTSTAKPAHIGAPRQEERAHRIAWTAVKRSYVKVGGRWIGRGRN